MLIFSASQAFALRDRLTPLPVTKEFLGLSDTDLLLLRSPGVDMAKWGHPVTKDRFRFVRDGKHQALFREGDFQVYVEDLETLENLSLSRNRGGTYGAYPVLKDSVLHLFGGYGFWHNSRAVIYFSKATAGWEASAINVFPHTGGEVHLGSFRAGDSILESPWLSGETYTNETNKIWRISIEDGARDFLGRIPLNLATNKPQWRVETKNHVLLVEADERMHLLRKNDLKIANLDNVEWLRWLRANKNKDFLQLVRGDVVEYWSDGVRALFMDLSAFAEDLGPDLWKPFVEVATFEEKQAAWRAWIKDMIAELEKSNHIQLDELRPTGVQTAFGVRLGILGASALCGLLLGWGLARKPREQLRTPHHSGSSSPNTSTSPPLNQQTLDKLSMSFELEQLLHCGPRTLSTSEFDELMGLDRGVAAETTRARRSRIIKDVQFESLTLLGHEILIRTRSKDDARKMEYKIRDYTDSPIGERIKAITQAQGVGEATK